VLRKGLQLASLAGLIALSLLYPLIESMDRWDAPGPASDTEIQVIAVLTLAGTMFVLAQLAATLLRASSVIDHFSSLFTQSVHAMPILVPTISHSPPAALRI
jgi:hypothetical protein